LVRVREARVKKSLSLLLKLLIIGGLAVMLRTYFVQQWFNASGPIAGYVL
jgi:hypothetical protein